MNENRNRFLVVLEDQYTSLFKTDAYAVPAARTTPAELARKMVHGLADGTANANGEGIKRTCKALGINNTYKSIREYLGAK